MSKSWEESDSAADHILSALDASASAENSPRPPHIYAISKQPHDDADDIVVVDQPPQRPPDSQQQPQQLQQTDEALLSPVAAWGQSWSSLTTSLSSWGRKLVNDAVGDNDAAAPSSLSSAVANLEALADQAEDMIGDFGSRLTNFLSSAITIQPPESDALKAATKKLAFDRKSAAVAALRRDPSTYITDPSATLNSSVPSERLTAERFISFRRSFTLQGHELTIARLLDDDDGDLKRILGRCVPSQVSREDFWCRYFFRVSEVEREDETRRRLVFEATMNDEEVGWESDDESSSVVPQERQEQNRQLDQNEQGDGLDEAREGDETSLEVTEQLEQDLVIGETTASPEQQQLHQQHQKQQSLSSQPDVTSVSDAKSSDGSYEVVSRPASALGGQVASDSGNAGGTGSAVAAAPVAPASAAVSLGEADEDDEDWE